MDRVNSLPEICISSSTVSGRLWLLFFGDDGFGAAMIHGDRSQSQRNGALNGFQEGRFQILVATDIAARG
jgi:superfamily II DNA/RNA helicase